MLAIQFSELGKPTEKLMLTEVPKPIAKAGEVLVKVTACNINPSDIMFVQGLYGLQPELPSSAGFEAAGLIEEAGPGTHLQPGTKVVFTSIGVWQEYVSLSEKAVIPVPKEIPDEVACQLFVNPLTAYAMLEVSGLKSGEKLLLTAGASAFSKFVIQLAREKGIEVYATVRHEHQKEELSKLGVHLTVNSEQDSLTRAILSETDGHGIDAVFDAVGGKLGMQALNCLSNGGTMYTYGLLSLQNIPLNSGLLIFKNLTVKGFWLTSWLYSLDGEERKKAITFLLSRFLNGQMKAPVEATYALKEFKKAIEHFEKPGRSGKIILKT